MIDYTEMDSNGELWELFARDFLEKLGFNIESSPDRGADGGKDLLVIENIKGKVHKSSFRWLVSCKHHAISKKAVSEKDEINIRERVESFKADGFIGFYSTLPSSGLNSRLIKLKENNNIKDFKIFDSKLIENYLVSWGDSKLLLRYFPKSYKKIKPKHLIFNEYFPLECSHCKKDLIENHCEGNNIGNLCYVMTSDNNIIDVYFACYGNCDKHLEDYYFEKYGAITKTDNISDLIIPALYIQWVIDRFNELELKDVHYTKEAFDKIKKITIALSQIVMREMTEQDRETMIAWQSYF